MSLFEVGLLLVAAHAVCDFALQGQYMSDAKNCERPLPGVPWAWPMTLHCSIHAAAVMLVTGSSRFALVEFVMHWLIDFARCRGRISFAQDQAAHITCKLVYLVWLGVGR